MGRTAEPAFRVSDRRTVARESIMKTIKLYSITLPLALLPLMAGLVIQVITGVADAAIVAFFQAALSGS